MIVCLLLYTANVGYSYASAFTQIRYGYHYERACFSDPGQGRQRQCDTRVEASDDG